MASITNFFVQKLTSLLLSVRENQGRRLPSDLWGSLVPRPSLVLRYTHVLNICREGLGTRLPVERPQNHTLTESGQAQTDNDKVTK